MKTILIFLLCFLLMGCSAPVETPDQTQEETPIKFQDKYSMDWSGEDSEYLMRLATYYGGSAEDQAFNIVVALNRVFSPDYPGTIREVVWEEIEGTGVDTDPWISDVSREALTMVMIDRIDETGGSFEYRR